MKNNILVRINNLNEINDYIKKGIVNFLFPFDGFSIGYPSFKLDEINNLGNEINVYLLLNRVFENNDCDNLRILKDDLSFCEGIIYEDIAVYQILKDTNIKLVWNQAHFGVNYHSINEWLNLGDSCMLSNELEKSELIDVLNNVTKPVILPIFGLNMAMYSRRRLLKSYSDNFNLTYSDSAILENNKVSFLAKENKYGTVYFYNKYFNLIPYLDKISNNNILLYYVDPNGVNSIDMIDILNGKEINYDNMFYENKTVYKIGDLK